MTESSFFETHFGRKLDEVGPLPAEQRAGVVRAVAPDLHWFLDAGRSIEERDAPERSRALARSLHDALAYEHLVHAQDAPAASLRERIVTDALLRQEADRDQNVYLGPLFTRHLTRAVPDLIFQPATLQEAAGALRWARAQGVPVTFRGAATTAMGGAVPGEGGLALDVSRLETIEIDAADRVCIVGAGARLRTVHERLAERGLALRTYPSNLGGTLAGWFVTGGIGLNAFGRGKALDGVRAADVLLPAGEHLRFHDDGRLDVPDHGRRRTLAPAESARWFQEQGLEPMTLADLAGSEGVLGLVLQLTVSIEPRPAYGAFLLAFASPGAALEGAAWIAAAAGAREAADAPEGAGLANGHPAEASRATSTNGHPAASRRFGAPANLKLLSASHVHQVRRVWQDEDARRERPEPSALVARARPWTAIVGPEALGARCTADPEQAGAFLYVDFTDLVAARAFAAALGECPGAPVAIAGESERFAAERFRPQQTKRLGPGLVAAEIVMPASRVAAFLPRAERLARHAGAELDAEVYFVAGGEALVIAATLTDHRRAGYLVDLALAPALLDLALSGYGGRPYVLGRWQAAYTRHKLGRAGAARLVAMKRGLDPAAIVNRGVALGLRLRGPLGAVLARGLTGGIAALRRIYALPLGPMRLARLGLGLLPGPGRGAPAALGARFRVAPPAGAATALHPAPSANGAPEQPAAERAVHCVNCGECNAVCPIFAESHLRLPQMLTHLGEAHAAGRAPSAAASVLLDLCMRCGNCEEVCQAGIPHLPLYQVLQGASDRVRPPDRERHAAILLSLRGSPRYQREFLDVRPGGYVKRSPAALPGTARFVLLRAENDAGAADTCIHCGACVPVCPTQANRELEGADPRWITTDQERCIGCGTCVEVCPANLANGGHTLRVMEAPTLEWFAALEEFETRGTR